MNKPSALVFSAPDKNNVCRQFHICEECWIVVALCVQGIEARMLKGRKAKPMMAGLFL
jgi:hypothetical protein